MLLKLFQNIKTKQNYNLIEKLRLLKPIIGENLKTIDFKN